MNKTRKIISVVGLIIFSTLTLFAQQPHYTKKHFVNYIDTTEFKTSVSPTTISTYLLSPVTIWDVDDDNTTHVKGGELCLIHIMGPVVNGKRTGIYTSYIIDKTDHSKRYKIYEQSFKDDNLNGEWKTFNLKGTRVTASSYKDGNLFGLSTSYDIDGKSKIEERDYFKDTINLAYREYYKNNILKREGTKVDGEMEGVAKRYYSDGTIQEEVTFKKGALDGIRKYYHPNGKVWLETMMKDNLNWTVIGNYDKNGKAREKGTLKDGNGTVYFYNEDGTVREIATFLNGVEKK